MFVFDLFEKKKQDAAAGRFVGGTSQDARVKNALDNAYRAVPAAKSPEEAALGYIDIQNSLNQKQDQALAQQNKTNQQQTQQINDLVADMRRKEKDFRDLNAQIANMPNVTPQQAAKMAQDIEAAHDAGKDQAVDVPNVVAKQTAAQPAKAVAAPGPGASVSQLANYQQAKDQGAATAKTTAKAPVATPQATPAPAAKAFGQMATQLTQPQSRVYKAKQPAQQELPVNVTAMPSTPASQQRLQQLAGAGFPSMDAANAGAYKQYATEATSPADLQAIAQHNNQSFSQAWAHSQSTKLYFGDGQWEDLTFQQIEQIVSAIATDYTEQARPQVWQQLFTDHNYFNEFKAQHLSQMPLQFSEGDVVPMTQDQSVLQAYNDVLEILKASKTKQPDVVTMMRQDWASRYKQRFQISTAPDGTYYMLDKTTNQRHRLPDPRTFPMEEDSWHNGQSSWSSEHDQWAKESVEETRLTVGDPVVVTAPNEYEGKTGEIAEFSPSGKFVIVNLYNYGEHSMHLSDVEYNKYADEEVDETIRKLGSQYRLYSGKGKNLGTFPTRAGAEKHEREVQYFKHAGESVAEAEGRVDPILIKALNRMPDGLATHREVLDAAYDAYAMELGRMEMKSNYGVTNAYIPQLMGLYKDKHGLTFNESDDGDWVDDPNTHAQVNRSGFNKLTPQSYADKIDFIDRQLADPRQQQNWPEFKQRRLDLVFAAQRAGIVKEQDVTEIKKGQKDSNGVTKCWSGYHAQGTKKSATTGKQVRNCVPNEGVEEAQTDYQKRRQRERDIDAGKPVARQPRNPQTDYARKRAKEKRDLEQFGESANYWTRLQNERNTKIASLVNELTESVKDIK